jgi:hypothetical protein
VDENVEKMAMKTMYNSYEFLVMQFGLCNAMLTFTTFMNSILDKFMIIYIDDILVYWNIIKKHVEHFGYVLNKFWQNKLFANRVKNEFSQEEMDFLRHILWKERLRLNLKKLQHMRNWKRPIMVKGIWSLLSLVKFY